MSLSSQGRTAGIGVAGVALLGLPMTGSYTRRIGHLVAFSDWMLRSFIEEGESDAGA